MASKPGIFTEWPWKKLGSFKYAVLLPWMVRSSYSFMVKKEEERDLGYFLVFPFLLFRLLHNQLWISFSRHRTAKGNNRIVDKGIDFEQVDREASWDDQVLFNGLLFYIGISAIPQASCLPFWRRDGVVLTFLLHAGPVEFLYYWLHRALHHHFLYSRYHSHHHSSIVTEPITSVIHPFAEHVVYFLLFAVPLLTTIFTGTASIVSFAVYITYIDFMNNLGHCNFELVPKRLFSLLPPLKYFFYTPSYHSLHHTQFRTNYALFMPFYDYVYGTMDKSSETLYEKSLQRSEELPEVVHLTHLTTPESIYHLRLGFSSVASKPYTPKWYLWVLWPVTCWSVAMTWIYGNTFILERNKFKNLRLQSWVVPRYNIQYFMQWRSEVINNLIEAAILDADKQGVKVLSLGLLNQGEELNGNGELYIKKHPQLKVKVVDGSSLAAAIVVNSIPKATTQVLVRGKFTKLALAIVDALCQKGIQVAVLYKEELEKLKGRLPTKCHSQLLISESCTQKMWIVGDGWRGEKEEERKAVKGSLFVPFSQFPLKKLRRDCFYHCPPAMLVPPSFENMHSCENWLPRKVLSAWRIAGIVHALEGWKENECGLRMLSLDHVWKATLQHGFRPLPIPAIQTLP